MEQITAYRASDGQIFLTEQECVEHEAPLRMSAEVEAFVHSRYYPYPNDVRRLPLGKKIVLAWERYKVRPELGIDEQASEDHDAAPLETPPAGL